MRKVVPSCAKAAGSGSQIAAARAVLAARVTAAVSWLLPVASLSAAVASGKQATVQQSNVSTTQPQTRALASSTVDARAEFQVAGAWGTAVAAFSANDSSQHGLATTQVNELAPPSFCKAIAQHVYLNTFSAYAAKCHLP